MLTYTNTIHDKQPILLHFVFINGCRKYYIRYVTLHAEIKKNKTSTVTDDTFIHSLTTHSQQTFYFI